MAKPLMAILRAVTPRIWYVCLALVATTAYAQPLADPTRPPGSFDEGMQDAGKGGPSGPVLQSVLIAPGRSQAIISGQTVRLGEKLGDARVVRITETEVVLRQGKETQVLKLFPNIERRSIASRGNHQSMDQVQDR